MFLAVAETRTLPGGWNVTNAKRPSQKGWVAAVVVVVAAAAAVVAAAAALHSPPAVTEAEVGWGCVAAEGWTAEVLQELEVPGVPAVSVEVGEATVGDSEDEGGWIGEVSVGRGVEDPPWTGWIGAEEDEEWAAHQVARWI